MYILDDSERPLENILQIFNKIYLFKKKFYYIISHLKKYILSELI